MRLLLLFLLLALPTSASPPTTQPIAYARFSPTHDDDLAWENDRIAFRLYGPAAEKLPPTGSGIDVWVKRSPSPIIDRWYAANSFKEDHGEGLDFYSVGSSLGCGGLAIWNGKTLDSTHPFATQKILNPGPKQAAFELTYAPHLTSTGRKVWQTRRITLDLGSNLNRITVTLHSDDPSPLPIAIGFPQRPGEGGEATLDKSHALLSYWQPPEPHGSIACAALLDPSQHPDLKPAANHYLALLTVTPDKPFTYYAGAAWSQSPDFPTPQSWLTYLHNFKPDFTSEPKETGSPRSHEGTK